MTREEALEWFKDRKEMYLLDDKCQQAEDMAIKALEQEPCEDAISRKDLLSKAWFITGDDFPIEGLEYITKGMVENMPSVIPKPKTGHWIIIDDCELFMAKCSECGEIVDSRMISKYPYCHCGARMEGSK